MCWECWLVDYEEGLFIREKILVCVKIYWVGEIKVVNVMLLGDFLD